MPKDGSLRYSCVTPGTGGCSTSVSLILAARLSSVFSKASGLQACPFCLNNLVNV